MERQALRMTWHGPSSRRNILKTLAALAVLCSVSQFAGCRPKPPPAKPWRELEGCKLVSNKSNDGDSFHVLHEGNEYIFRLYFVDTPETEMDSQMESRIADQAAYFRITTDQALEIGKDAAAFTSKRLSGTFTVYTRFRRAPGRSSRPRYYAMVMVGRDDLAQLLIKNGLARIYGARTPLPDGTDSRTYLAKLKELEDDAKTGKVGARRSFEKKSER